jgi:TatD DNase family protein
MIIDTHAHYDDEKFNEDRDLLLHSLKENDIEYVVNIGASIKTTRNTLELIKQYDFIYGAIGVHPSETGELNEDNFSWLKEQAKTEKVVAIGEIGLDYYWDEPDRIIQKMWFDRQMELAKEVNLPIVIHSRDAAKDTLDMMKAAKVETVGGVIHCFSYGIDMAKEYLKMGFYLGIGGVVTFNNAKKLKEVVEYTPLDRIVLETDCPYLSPVPNRGKRNSSLNLVYVVDEIAKIKNIDTDEIIQVTNQNAKDLYRIGR